MRFLLTVHVDEGRLRALPNEAQQRLLSASRQHADDLQACGILLLSHPPGPVTDTATVRTHDGHTRISHGPLARDHALRTGTLLVGVNVIDACDHAEALRIAQEFPWVDIGSIEVRALSAQVYGHFSAG